MKTVRLAGLLTLTLTAFAACDDGVIANPDIGPGPSLPVVTIHGQVVNGRAQPVPAAKLVLSWVRSARCSRRSVPA